MALKIQKDYLLAWRPWLSPVIPAAQQAEIRRITVPSQPGQSSLQDPISMGRKKKSHKRAGGVAKGVGPEFKYKYFTKTKKVSLYRSA
jgi:hypothetical protein